jgi:glyoxylase-like metal-dependent hydrolase (beta-lactamase superfamily II)
MKGFSLENRMDRFGPLGKCFPVKGVIIAHLYGRLLRALRWRNLAGALASACAVTGTAAAAASAAYGPLDEVAPGVYVQRGADEAPSTANRGAIANLGVLVGPTGVIVVNTGSSTEHATALLAAVARLTDRPVVLAINTQASPDQVLGNSAFTRRGIPVLAHRETDSFMRAHCDACVADVKSKADTDALAATRIAWPTRLIDGSMTLRVGGRALRILYFGWTEQPGSIAVLDVESGVLFTGELASSRVIPQIQLGQLGNWLDALRDLQALSPALVVPAHGPPGRASLLASTSDYLQSLLNETRAAYGRGDGLMETVDHLNMPKFSSWALYDAHHRRNVHFTYLQIEEEDLKK